MAQKKKRLDIRIKELGLAQNRSKAQALIMSGAVEVNGTLVTKAGFFVGEDDNITLRQKGCPYVSRGGLKLEAAIKYFNITIKDKICLDVGASTGGFTDCLLKHGAKLIYALDVGYGQLDWSLRNRKEIINMEKVNIRHVTKDMFPEAPQLATIDTSFISLKLVVPNVLNVMKDECEIVALIKPQFEAGREKVGKGGIIKDKEIHKEVVDNLTSFFKEELALKVIGTIESPILGAKGNREFLTYLKRDLGGRDVRP